MHPVGLCRIYYVTLLAKNVRIRLRAFGALAGRSRAYLLAGLKYAVSGAPRKANTV